MSRISSPPPKPAPPPPSTPSVSKAAPAPPPSKAAAPAPAPAPAPTPQAPSPAASAPTSSQPRIAQTGVAGFDPTRHFLMQAPQGRSSSALPRPSQPSSSPASSSVISRGTSTASTAFTQATASTQTTSSNQASTLLNESIGDGRSNCLERAYTMAGPKDSVTLLRDARDPVGHAVIERPDGSVVDPNSPTRPYPTMDAYLQQNPHYSTLPAGEGRQIPKATLSDVFATPAGSQARLGALQTAGLAAISSVKVADGATDAQITNNVIGELQRMSASGSDAAQLTAAAYDLAVEQVRQAYPNMPAAERMDTAVAIATYALNGPDQIANLRMVDSGRTSVVAKMEGIQASGLVPTWNNGGLDRSNGGGTLNPAFNDGTNNQAFHTNFFIAAGYVAGQDPAKLALAFAGNVYHETLDRDAWGNGGGSIADYAASSMGIMIGKEMYAARDVAAQADRGEITYGGNLDLLIPSMAYGGMSSAGNNPPRVQGQTEEQYQASIQMSDAVRGIRDNVLYQAGVEHNPLYNLGVLFFQIPPALNRLLGRM